MQTDLPQTEIVILGAGHTNAHVLRMWKMQPIPRARLTCISNFPVATYSGMMPGTLAGQYDREQMEVDLVRLCAASGVRLILDSVVGLDCQRRQLLFERRPPLDFDWLSIGIGSQPARAEDAADVALAVKPMQTFLERLDARLANASRAAGRGGPQIAVIGAGAAGFEVACCLDQRLHKGLPAERPTLHLVDGGAEILSGATARVRDLATRELQRRGIQVSLGAAVERINEQRELEFSSGDRLAVDLAIWTTSAQPPSLLARFDLPTDDRGFLLTRDTLQSTGCDAVFVVGDSGTMENQRRPKAGVFAVRQGPILWENLRRAVQGDALRPFRAQGDFLRILNTGDGRAIASYRGLSAHRPWCWRLKDWIDRRFMAKYQDYRPVDMQPSAPPAGESKPYCGGCGCKLPAASLTRVLRQLENPSSEHVVIGLDDGEDVAVVTADAGGEVAATVDFFTDFVDDPWLLGQIAALNALSDLYAKQTKPRAALAMVALPHGGLRRQESYLAEVLHGALEALRPAHVPIVGGHTIEAAQAMIGFTILGSPSQQPLSRKNLLSPGDVLILTKPLGVGILLAARMQAACRADWYEPLLASMLQSNRQAALAAAKLGVKAMTDVTGFGLAGHLSEMLDASACSAVIELEQLSLLPGVAELAAQGIESTLSPGNRAAATMVKANASVAARPAFAALFDPQTSGGLLLAVPPAKLQQAVSQLGPPSCAVGKVVAVDRSGPSIRVVANAERASE